MLRHYRLTFPLIDYISAKLISLMLPDVKRTKLSAISDLKAPPVEQSVCLASKLNYRPCRRNS